MSAGPLGATLFAVLFGALTGLPDYSGVERRLRRAFRSPLPFPSPFLGSPAHHAEASTALVSHRPLSRWFRRVSLLLYGGASDPFGYFRDGLLASVLMVLPSLLLYRELGAPALSMIALPFFAQALRSSESYGRWTRGRAVNRELPFFLVYAAQAAASGSSLFSALTSLAGSPLKALEAEGKRLLKLYEVRGLDEAQALQEFSKGHPSRAFARVLSSYSFKEASGVSAAELLRSETRAGLEGLERQWRAYASRAEGMGEISLAAFAMLPMLWVTLLTLPFGAGAQAYYYALLALVVASFGILVLVSSSLTPLRSPPPLPPALSLILSSLAGLPFFTRPGIALLASAASVASCNGSRFLLDSARDMRRLTALSSLLDFLESEAMAGKGASEALRDAEVAFEAGPLRDFVRESVKRSRLGLPLRWYRWGFSSFVSWLTAKSIERGELDPSSLRSLSDFSSSLVTTLGDVRSQLYSLAAISAASPFMMAVSAGVAGGLGATGLNGGLGLWFLVALSSELGAWALGKLSGLSLRFTLPPAVVLPLVFLAFKVLRFAFGPDTNQYKQVFMGCRRLTGMSGSDPRAGADPSSNPHRTEVTEFYPEKGYLELKRGFPEESYLWNEDFHPTPVKFRNWGTLTYFAIWFGMSVEVESWALVSVGYSFGLDWFWSLMAVLIGNLIVLIPILIISHGGARYGVPETPLTRSRWGVYGTWIPSLLRGIIGAGWWGIDTWIITEAIGAMYVVATGQVGMLLNLAEKYPATLPFLISTINPALFWSVFALTIAARLLILYFSPPKTGQRALKVLSWTLPFISFIGFLVLFMSVMGKANWQWASILSVPTTVKGSAFWYAFIGLINANVAFWATMAISMPDYSRFAKSQFAQTVGQIPMPFLMTGVAAFALITTGASYAVYGFPIWDPIVLATVSVSNPWLAYLSLFLLLLGVIIVNIYADTVGPGYDFSNLYPKKLDWFKGVLIVVVVAAALQSWTYYFSAFSYVEGWLLTYGALLGGVEGVIIFDYAVIRRFKFELADLYLSRGRFRYWKGINPAAVVAFALSMVLVFPPNAYLPVSVAQLYPGQAWVYQNAWVSAILISGAIYLPLMKYWVIPKYQPELKGGLLKGYIADDTREVFSAGQGSVRGRTPGDASEDGRLRRARDGPDERATEGVGGRFEFGKAGLGWTWRNPGHRRERRQLGP